MGSNCHRVGVVIKYLAICHDEERVASKASCTAVIAGDTFKNNRFCKGPSWGSGANSFLVYDSAWRSNRRGRSNYGSRKVSAGHCWFSGEFNIGRNFRGEGWQCECKRIMRNGKCNDNGGSKSGVCKVFVA